MVANKLKKEVICISCRITYIREVTEMLKNEEFALTKELTKEQQEAARNFIQVLFQEGLSEFWNILCDIDKSRIYGLYEANHYYDSDVELHGFVQEIRDNVRAVYAPLQGQGGISTKVRYTSEGKMYVYILGSGENPRVYPVGLMPETYIEEERFSQRLQISIYNDEFRNVAL